MNYTDLQTNVANYLHRSDLAAKIPGFIALAESMLFRELQVKEMQVSANGTTTGEYGTLPADFDTLSKLTVNTNGRETALDYKDQWESVTKAVPDAFSLENNQIRIWGAGTGQAYKLYYIPKIASLSGTNPTNWLLDNACDLYFYASVLEAARYARNDPEIQKISPMIPALLQAVKDFATRRAIPVTGSLQIKVRRG